MSRPRGLSWVVDGGVGRLGGVPSCACASETEINATTNTTKAGRKKDPLPPFSGALLTKCTFLIILDIELMRASHGILLYYLGAYPRRPTRFILVADNYDVYETLRLAATHSGISFLFKNITIR